MVDADDQVREDAHELLERYGCIVETAHKGDEAVLMVRSSGGAGSYDVIISDIRLPDYSGYQLMLRLGKIMDRVPMVLMTGFGYDPGHSIVKARQNGLPPKCVLFKPFRLDQLIDVVKTILEINKKYPPRPKQDERSKLVFSLNRHPRRAFQAAAQSNENGRADMIVSPNILVTVSRSL